MMISKKGNIIVALLFLLIVTVTGLAILSYSIEYGKLFKARTVRFCCVEKSFQIIIPYLHDFRERVWNQNLNEFPEPEKEFFSEYYFPDVQNDTYSQNNRFKTLILTETPHYEKRRILANFLLSLKKSGYRTCSQGVADILNGEIPVTEFPVLIDKPLNEPLEEYLTRNRILIGNDSKAFIDEVSIQNRLPWFLVDGLKLPKSGITWRAIRERFGLPPSDEPIHKGIYFLYEAGIIESLFIQGDLDKVTFYADGDLQGIIMLQDGIHYELKYCPGKHYFACWNPTIDVVTLFKERIIVNGSIYGVEQAGDYGFLEGTDIQMLVAGKVIINTSLTSENMSNNQVKLTNLTIVTAEKDFFTDKPLKSDILLNTGTGSVIQATLISSSRILNKSGKVEVKGSLFGRNIINDGILSIDHVKTRFQAEKYFRTAQMTCLCRFFVDFVGEEVYE